MYDMPELPTDPPDYVFGTTYCHACGEHYGPENELTEGDDCPKCDAPDLEELEPEEPCRCTGHTCYC